MRVYSIFQSIDGEVNFYHQGRLTTFIRLAGCNLNCCSYCDTRYALKENSGKEISVKDVFNEVEKIGCKNITIAGGEPLLQLTSLIELVSKLKKENYKISIETNGSIIPPYIMRLSVSYVMDYKLLSSGMTDKMNLKAFLRLNEKDFVKFVVKNKEDYEQAKEVMANLKQYVNPIFAFSSIYDVLDPRELIVWMMTDKIDGVLNLQLHKYLGLIEDK